MAGVDFREVAFQRPSRAVNALGEDEIAWAAAATVWAERRPVSDGERVRAQQVGGAYTHRFTLRWLPALESMDTTWRLLCEGKTYDITAVKEEGRRHKLEVTAMVRAEAAA